MMNNNMVDLNDIHFYYCYSKFQKEFLTGRGNRYITKAKNARNNCVFWLFIITEKLSRDIDVYIALQKERIAAEKVEGVDEQASRFKGEKTEKNRLY